MVIVFRGTETKKEWIENFTITMEQLSGETKAPWSLPFWGNQVHSVRYLNQPINSFIVPSWQVKLSF